MGVEKLYDHPTSGPKPSAHRSRVTGIEALYNHATSAPEAPAPRSRVMTPAELAHAEEVLDQRDAYLKLYDHPTSPRDPGEEELRLARRVYNHGRATRGL